MFKRFVLSGLAATILLGTAGTASAGIIASLTFNDPTGIIGPNDSVPVWLTLTLGANSDPVVTDAFSVVTSPVPDWTANIWPGLLRVPYFQNDHFEIIVNEGYGCGQTFVVAGCTSGTPYNFNFNFDPPAFVTPANLNLNPGNSYTWLFGTFSPSGGPVPVGTYSFPYATVDFYISDLDILVLNGQLDPNGYPEEIASVHIADTGVGAPFERTVVPEPATWLFMISGLTMAVGGALRRKLR